MAAFSPVAYPDLSIYARPLLAPGAGETSSIALVFTALRMVRATPYLVNRRSSNADRLRCMGVLIYGNWVGIQQGEQVMSART